MTANQNEVTSVNSLSLIIFAKAKYDIFLPFVASSLVITTFVRFSK